MNTSDDDDLSNSIIFGPAKPDTATRELPFLDPPRGPDEIGRLGDFRVIRVLGKGGMGIVFEAEDTHLHRTVALKVLRPEVAADPDNRERFLREARAAAAIESEYVATIYQVGTLGMTAFLVMQYLHGMTLQARLDKPQRLGLRTALLIARQAAVGLQAAHARGLIHRDIKPANLWLESSPDGGTFRRVRILDFGLARRLTSEPGLTATGFVIGTPNYMAPEQANGDPIDHRADLFSLGCVLYVMLTGEMAFPGESTMKVFLALASKTPPPVLERNPAVPPPVAELVDRLLAKDRNDRPDSAQEVIATLDAALATPLGPVETPPPQPASRVVPVAAAETGSSLKADTKPEDTAALRRAGQLPEPRRKWPVWVGGLAALVAVAGVAWFALKPGGRGGSSSVAIPTGEPIKVGVLHSRTGTMAVSELPIIDATMLAIEELNRTGGVLGRPVQAIAADGKSDPEVFDDEAVRLLTREKVVAIFGCQTSASRKAVRGVVERNDGLLFFPASHEGLEQSPRIVYVGAAANQKFLPSVDYVTEVLGKRRLFFVGSDLISPRAGLELVKDRLKARKTGAVVVEAVFFPLGSKDVSEAIDRIEVAKPDAIINVIHGGTNFAFFKELRARGVRSSDIPTMSVSMTEHELRGMAGMAGDYLAASYFQAIDREENRVFLQKVRDRYGADRAATDNMVHAYTAVHLWGKAATAAGSPDAAAVAKAVRGIEHAGPGANVKIDEENQHAWRPYRIGRVQSDGKVKVVFESKESVRPVPFPDTRTKQEWEQLLSEFYVGWGNRWQLPGLPDK
jgi:urea transport system substrate-binding protein